MTLARLKELVRAAELRYVQVGGGGMGGGSGLSSEVAQWVHEHGTAVEEAESTPAVYRLDPSDVD
ncbi:hypothetical protein RI578_25670 [Streptomyces sp. BB1-1-1]|nr:hypothetical protein [Streptomyces sp. BB1-1-1]WND37468.1 hypothetical protein RI578_25670 [Streptomyces sp. BB1-1-1]